MEKRHKTGVIIGRFQVPFLHEGHIHLITQVQALCDQVVILLGVTTKDEKNPLPFIIRKEMILQQFSHCVILPLGDCPNDNKKWSRKVDIIAGAFEDVTLFGSRDSFKRDYLGDFPYFEVQEIPNISGTELRRNFVTEHNASFRAGIIYASQLKKEDI